MYNTVERSLEHEIPRRSFLSRRAIDGSRGRYISPSSIFHMLYYVANWLNRLPFIGSTSIRMRTAHSTATDPRVANTIRTIIWQVSSYLSFSIEDRFLSIDFRNHQSYGFGIFRHVWVPLDLVNLLTFENYASLIFQSSHSRFVKYLIFVAIL